MKSPFISIVIPFYNLENCVSYCIESILAQTYESFEVLCVDDGSTDNTGKILDDFGTKDSRIRVIHKNNGGLSDARNWGISGAKGDYITFVDGDDLVSPYYLEALVLGLNLNPNIDLVIGTSKRLPSAKISEVEFKKPSSASKISHEDLCRGLMYEEILPSAWAHLAPRAIYEKHNFPVGQLYEEISTITTYVNAAKEYALVEEPIYGYVMREGSIVHRKQALMQQVTDYENAIETYEKYMIDCGYGGSPELIYFKALNYSRIFRLLDTSLIPNKEKLMNKFAQYITENLDCLCSNSRISKGNKIRFMILAKLPNQYCRIFSIFDLLRG